MLNKCKNSPNEESILYEESIINEESILYEEGILNEESLILRNAY